jgi:hypothetical protein
MFEIKKRYPTPPVICVDTQGEQRSEAKIVRVAPIQNVNSLHTRYMARILSLEQSNRSAPTKVTVDKIRFHDATMSQCSTPSSADEGLMKHFICNIGGIQINVGKV